MPEAVIVSALRTPIGTAMKGTLRDTDAYQLADHIVGATTSELDAHVDRSDIDDLILGEGLYGGGVVARYAAVTAGPDLGARAWPSTGTARPDSPRCRARPRASGPAWTGW